MQYKIINNNAEWEEFYWYNGKPKKYPTSYPCIAKIEDYDGGLCGDYKLHYVIYIPQEFESMIDAFLCGVQAEWIQIC